MKIKTSELTGIALDWAVAKCDGEDEHYVTDPGQFPLLHNENGTGLYCYSTNWSQGGPIIDRERINTLYHPDINCATKEIFPRWIGSVVTYSAYGPTTLIAAMRCYVASRLGDEVEVPDELL